MHDGRRVRAVRGDRDHGQHDAEHAHHHADTSAQGVGRIRVTVVRAGQMAGPGSTTQFEPESGMRFFQAAIKKGLNPMERGISAYDSVLHVFRMIVDSPADIRIGTVTIEARIAV